MNGFDEDQILNLRQGKSENTKLNALVALAADLTENRGYASSEMLEQFYSAGYNQENLVDLILQISDKIAMNYLHNLTKVPVDFPVAPSI